jgi:hypothetical protein
MSRVNQPHDRGQAVLLSDLPLVRLETVVSDGQAMPTVQAILRASRNAPGIEVVSIGVSIVRRLDFASHFRRGGSLGKAFAPPESTTEWNRCGYRPAQEGGCEFTP